MPAENHLWGTQHGEMNPEHFSNSLKIPLESTWVIKSEKQRMRSPLVLITPREREREPPMPSCLPKMSLNLNSPLLRRDAPVLPDLFFFLLSTPTFPRNWLNTAICIIVIFFCFQRGLLSVKVNYKALTKRTFTRDEQFSNREENCIISIEFILHLETKYSKLIAPWAAFNPLSFGVAKEQFPETWVCQSCRYRGPRLEQWRHFSWSWGFAVKFVSRTSASPIAGIATRSETNLLTSHSLGLLKCKMERAFSHRGAGRPCAKEVGCLGLGT